MTIYYDNRMRWMTGTGGSSSNSWEVWWREENGYLSKFGLGQKLQCMIKPVFYLIIGVSHYNTYITYIAVMHSVCVMCNVQHHYLRICIAVSEHT
jgi:hypothetical protein